MINNKEGVNLKKEWKLVNFCEYDKYAARAYCSMHDVDENLNLGDITKVDENEISDFNMICGGSPCQDFSLAGKQKGSVWTCEKCTDKNDKPFEWNPLTVHYTERHKCPNCGSENIDKTRSSLLVEWLRIIEANKPNFGIYENVKNIVGKQFKETTFKLFTSELEEYGYSVYWKVLNAKYYGVPQNRERVYLILVKKDLDNGQFKFPEPFDNRIRLKDVLEDEVDEKYYLSDDKVRNFIRNNPNINIDKECLGTCHERNDLSFAIRDRVYNEEKNSPTLTATMYKDAIKVLQVGNIVNTGNWDNPQRGRIYAPEGCSPSLNCCGGGGGLEPKIVCGIDKSVNDTKKIEYANCLTAREDRGISNRKSEGTVVLECGRTGNHQKDGIYDTDEISPTLLATHYKQPIQVKTERLGNINPSGSGMNGNVFSENGLAPTITTNKGEGNKIAIKQATKKGYIECEKGGVADLSYPDSKTRRGRVQESGHISPTITATETNICKIESDIRIRKLIPLECYRLMGFTDEEFYKAMLGNTKLAKEFIDSHPWLIGKTILNEAETIQGISNSQLYKTAGNSIVVDVLYYILVELYKAMPYLFDDLKLSSFFSGIGAFECSLKRLYESINSGNFTIPQVE